MQHVFLLSLAVVIWGPLVPYAHALVVPAAYGVLSWLSYIYMDEIRAKLEEIDSKELSAMAWFFSYLMPAASLMLFISAYFARVHPDFLKAGLFIFPAVVAWLIMKLPPGTRLLTPTVVPAKQ